MYRVFHIQVIKWLIQKDIVRILCNNHGYKGSLTLSTAKLINIRIGKILQIGECNCFLYFLPICCSQSSFTVWKTSKSNQVPNRKLHIHLIGLLKDGKLFRQFATFIVL